MLTLSPVSLFRAAVDVLATERRIFSHTALICCLSLTLSLTAQTPAQLELRNKARSLGSNSSSIAHALDQKRALDDNGGTTTVGDVNPAPPPRWVSLGSLGLSATGTAQTRGPALAGRITGLVTDSRTPGLVYLAAAGGGLWRSTDSGDTWQSMGDQILSLSSGTLALDERVGAQGALYYGTGDFVSSTYGVGILRSLDGGLTWQELSTQFERGQGQTLKIALHPTDPQTIYIARDSGVWATRDGGNTWNQLLAGFASDVVISPGAPNLLFAALGSINGDKANGVYRSIDNGNTWTLLTALPNGITTSRISLATTAASASAVVAMVSSSADYSLTGIYRSDDFGGAWRQLSGIGLLFFNNNYNLNRGWYEQVLSIDPQSANTIYVGGEDLYRSTDGGNTWQTLSLNSAGQRSIHQGVLAMNIPAGGTGALVVGTEAGVYRTTNGGASWLNLNRALPISQINGVAVNKGGTSVLAAAEVTGLMSLGGEFTNWTQLLDGHSGSVFFDPTSSNIYGQQIQTQPVRSADGGANWTSLASGISTLDAVWYYAPFLSDANGNLLFGTSRVWRSTNQGTIWTAASPQLATGTYLTALGVASTGRTYAAAADGRAWFSADGSTNWTLSTGLPGRWITSIAADPKVPLRAYLGITGFGAAHVYRTVDGGVSWQNITGNLPVAPANGIVVDPRGPIYVATDVGVFRNNDGNSVWTSYNQGLPNTIITSLAADAVSNTLVAGTFGRGAFQISMSAPDAALPSIKAGGIVDAGSDTALLSPGTLGSIFGANLVSSADAAALTTVQVNGAPTQVLFASATQINFLVPLGTSVSNATVSVTTPTGSTAAFVLVAATAPGIYSGSVLHLDGTPVTSANPAHSGETLTVGASGLGSAPSTLPISATVGAASAPIAFAAIAAPGVYQLNLTIPAGVTGDVSLVITSGPRSSNPVTISVR